MTASFQIDQPSGAGTGTAGQSRIDLWEGIALNLSCLSPPPGATFLWQILGAPLSSSAIIINPTSQVAHFTPDTNLESWRVELTINSGGPGLVFVFILSCAKNNVGVSVLHGWRLPAIDEQTIEQNQGGNVDGWAPDWVTMIRDIGARFMAPVVTATNYVMTDSINLRVNATSGAIAVTGAGAGRNSGKLFDGQRIRVKDSFGQAAAHNITVAPLAGVTLEDPNTPGTFVASTGHITLGVNGASVEWEYDAAAAQLELA